MTLNEAEKTLLLAQAHNFVDKFLPALLDIEVAKLPAPYGALVEMVMGVLKAPAIAKGDEMIDAALAPAGV